MNDAMQHVAPGNYSAEIAISSWQLCYGIGSGPGFALSLAGQFSLRNPNGRSWVTQVRHPTDFPWHLGVTGGSKHFVEMPARAD